MFGFDAARGEDARMTAPYAALWYAIFILPMLLFTPDSSSGKSFAFAINQGLQDLWQTFKHLWQRKKLLRFFIARMIYQDGVNGLLALGGVFAAGLFGWQTFEIGVYGILLLVTAIFGCYLGSRLEKTSDSSFVVNLSLGCLTLATIGIISIAPDNLFFGLISLSHCQVSHGKVNLED